jgi:hypothetical protein
MKNKELEEKMTYLYLDGYGPDDPPIPDIFGSAAGARPPSPT